jgi:type I restriction enzyme S subunit
MSVENNVPEIRFKGFSGEWEERILGSLCLIGDIDHRMPESKTTGIPYLMTGDFYGINGLDFSRAKLISIEDYEQLSKKIKPEFGDILFARYASVGAVRYVETDTKFLISYSCAILKTNNTTYGKYLFYFFQTERTQGQLELDINTGSQRNIGIDSLKSLLVVLPKPAEQTAIGNTFQKLDSLINQHQQKHDKLSNIKKAMLEKMFPKQGETIPEIRFKGFSGEWEERLLGDKMTVSSVKRIHQSDWTTSGVRFLRARDIVSSYKNEEPADYLYIAQEKYEQYSQLSGKVEVGDLLVTGVGTIGVPMLITNDEPVYFKDGNIIWFKNENAINGLFLFYSFGGKQIQTYIKHSAGTGTVGTYTINSGKCTPIKLPKNEEQTAIGNYFQKLDTLINQHQQQITKLNNIKQACLSKMFI